MPVNGADLVGHSGETLGKRVAPGSRVGAEVAVLVDRLRGQEARADGTPSTWGPCQPGSTKTGWNGAKLLRCDRLTDERALNQTIFRHYVPGSLSNAEHEVP